MSTTSDPSPPDSGSRSPQTSRGMFASTVTLGRVGGVEIGINWTWLAIFALIVWSLAGVQFPRGRTGPLVDGVRRDGCGRGGGVLRIADPARARPRVSGASRRSANRGHHLVAVRRGCENLRRLPVTRSRVSNRGRRPSGDARDRRPVHPRRRRLAPDRAPPRRCSRGSDTSTSRCSFSTSCRRFLSTAAGFSVRRCGRGQGIFPPPPIEPRGSARHPCGGADRPRHLGGAREEWSPACGLP